MSHELNDVHNFVSLDRSVDIFNNILPGALNFLHKIVIIWNLHRHLSVVLDEIIAGDFFHSPEALAVLILGRKNLFGSELSLALPIEDCPCLVNHIGLSLAHLVVTKSIHEFVVTDISIPINVIELVEGF